MFGARYNYNDGQKVPLKLPKNFMNTQANIDIGELLDGPIHINLEREVKNNGNWHSRKSFKLVFKRKITFNAISYQFWKGEPPKKVEEEKVEEGTEKAV